MSSRHLTWSCSQNGAAREGRGGQRRTLQVVGESRGEHVPGHQASAAHTHLDLPHASPAFSEAFASQWLPLLPLKQPQIGSSWRLL